MKQLKKKLRNSSMVADTIASAALVFSIIGANTCCCFIYHQPEKPNLDKLRRF